MTIEIDILKTGLYRTTLPYPGHEKAVPGRHLILLNTENEHGKPVILMPEKVVSNQWFFRNRGMLANDEGWLDTLVPLQTQGFYKVIKQINGPRGVKLPPALLVQLGYRQNGDPLIFPGTFEEGAKIVFGVRGILISDLQINNLEMMTFKLAAPPKQAQDQPQSPVAKPFVKPFVQAKK